jgi:hypothetical protein
MTNCDLDHFSLNGKFCPKCGATLGRSSITCTQGHPMEAGTKFCYQCGSPQGQGIVPPPVAYQVPPQMQQPMYSGQGQMPMPVAPTSTNGMAVAALVTSIVCCAPLGLVFGLIALNQIKANPSQGGKGLAIAGIVIGSIGMFFGVIWLFAYGLTGY